MENFERINSNEKRDFLELRKETQDFKEKEEIKKEEWEKNGEEGEPNWDNHIIGADVEGASDEEFEILEKLKGIDEENLNIEELTEIGKRIDEMSREYRKKEEERGEKEDFKALFTRRGILGYLLSQWNKKFIKFKKQERERKAA